MMLRTPLATVLGALIFAGLSFAAEPKKPLTCPSMLSLQAEGLTSFAEVLEGMYVTYNLSHYDTVSNWIFIMGPFAAMSSQAALKHSNQILSTLSGSPSPEEDGDNSWICEYHSNEQFSVYAIHADDMTSPLKMHSYRHHFW